MNKLSRRFSGLFNSRKQKKQRAYRRLRAESLESRALLAADFLYSLSTNPFDSEDVNGDHQISPVDALAVINALNDSGKVAQGEDVSQLGGKLKLQVDVSNDGALSPIDALLVINVLNGEGEHAGEPDLMAYTPVALDANVIGPFRFGADFNDNGASGDTIVRSDSGSWIEDGFVAGGKILVSDAGEFLEVDVPRQLFTYNNPKTAPHPETGATVRDPNNGTPVLAFVDDVENPNGQFDYPDPVVVVVSDPTPEMPMSGDEIEDIDFKYPQDEDADEDGDAAAFGDFSVDQRFQNNGMFTIQSVSDDTITFDSSVQLHDMSGNNNDVNATFFRPITSVGPGEDFILGMLVEDLRPKALTEVGATQVTIAGRTLDIEQPRGPFSAYVDVVFDSGLVMTKSATPTLGDVTFRNFLEDQPSGSFATPGLIDEIGGVTFATPANSPLGRGQQLAWTTLFKAGSSMGTVVFSSDPADLLPNNDSLLSGLNESINPIVEIDFQTATIDIEVVTDITARADTATVDENAGPVFINVLANDSITTGTGPTITAPIPTTSANGGTVVQSGANGFNYTPAANFSGQDTFSYTITNGSATASATVTVTVNPLDNRPVITGPNSQSTNEDTPFTLSGFTITDPDSTNITVTLSANGGLSQTTFSGTPAQVTTTLNSITYTPIANSNAADTLNISASDDTLTGTKNVSITINPINDPPVNVINGLGNPPAVTVVNIGTHTFPNGTFQVTDVDPGNTLNVTVSVLHGTLSSGANTGASLSFSGSSPVNIASLVYDPTDGFAGADTLTITSTDGTATDTDTVAITVAPPQFPFAAGDTYTTTEGAGTITLNPSPLNNDLRDAGATLTATPLNGATTQGGSFTINGSTFTYTPPANPNFFGTDTFNYTIMQDAAHTPSSTGDDESTGTVTINIQPVNDGPVNTVSGARQVNEDTTLVFNGANLISIQDIDAGAANVTTTLTASNGRINVTGGAGVSNNGSKNVSISGTVTQVNSALAGLTYAPDLNFNGSDQLTINTNDNGNTGGGALTDVDIVNITITPINDAPTIAVPGQQTFFTDFDNRFTSTPNPFQISDVDAGNSNVQVDLTIDDGAVTLVNSTGVTVTQNPGGNNGVRITGSVTNINTALANGVNYRSSVDGNKTLSAVVNDLGNTGSGNQLTATATVAVEVLDFVPVDIHGHVFIDSDGDNQQDPEEPGIEGVHVLLSGTDFQGNLVNVQATTDASGGYSFLGLRPNAAGQPYTITQQQPAFIQGGGQATFNLDALGNLTVQSGSLSFGADGFIPEFADVWDVFDSSDIAPQNSGVLIGMDSGGQDWSIFYGGGWNMQRYGNARLSLNQGGSSGVLTVFDTQAGQDRTANVSVNNGSLTYRGFGVDRVYRVIGGSELLGLGNGAPEGENTNGANATTDIAVYTAAVDSIFDRG